MRTPSALGSLALAVLALAPTFGLAQYAPKWRVGDWWIVKSRMGSMAGRGWQWDQDRYDVLNIEKVGDKDCFVLQKGSTESPGSGPRKLYYVRTDYHTIVKTVEYFWQAGKLLCNTSVLPEYAFGPDPSGLLPLFPLDTATAQDTTFHHYVKGGYLRQLPSATDSIRGCFLGDPNPKAGTVVRPGGGRMYSALCESGAQHEPDGPLVPRVYSIQLWSEDFPWRLFWELGEYKPGEAAARMVAVQSWLVACGRAGGR